MNIRHLLLTAVALAWCAPVSLRAAEAVEIQQHWLAGRKYYQTIQTDQQSTLQMGAQKIEQATSMTMELTMTVNRPPPGQPKRMAIRYERMAMDVTVNGQKLGFDSANPDANSDPLNLKKTIGATVGQELKIVLNDQDEVESIENYDQFIQHLGPAAAPGLDPAKMFSRDSLTQMLKQGGLQGLPGKAVSVGDSWSFHNQVELPQIGKVTVSGTYTLQGVGDHDGVRCAEIQTDGTLAMDLGATKDDGSPISALGMKVSEGSIKGPVWFDLQLGIARDTQLVQETTISMKNPADASATISVPMKQNIHVKLTKVEDVK